MVGELSGALSRSELLRGALGVAAVAGGFRAGAAVSVIGSPRLPQVTGPYEQIGCRLLRAGPTRARVKVFYPASAPSSTVAPYCTDGRETSDGMAGLVGFRQLGLSYLLAHLAGASSGCWLDAAPASGDELPLLCYSHGFGGNMDMATYLMRQMASYGVVVAAIEHTDGTASRTIEENGQALPFSPRLLSREAQLRRRADELLAVAQPGALGTGLPAIDRSRVFLGGHSYGGPTALLASTLPDASTAGISGLLLHDPALGMNAGIDAAVSGVRRSGSPLPTLSYVSDEYDAARVRCGTTAHVIGGRHGNFVDAPLWAPLWVMRPLSAIIPAAGPVDPRRLHSELASTGSCFMRSASASSAASISQLLELRGGLCGSPSPSSSASFPSPFGAMTAWRTARLNRFAAAFDASRYHAQILFVDDDGARAVREHPRPRRHATRHGSLRHACCVR